MNRIDGRTTVKVYPEEGYVIKPYDNFPSILDIQYYYRCVHETGVLPQLFEVYSNKAKWEYISSFDGYEAHQKGEDIVRILCEIASKIRYPVNCNEINECLLYESRMKSMFLLFKKRQVDYNKDDKLTIKKVLEDINKEYYCVKQMWEQTFLFDKRYLVHGDLHLGNMLFDEEKNTWRVIDPIVSVAPLEFEYVRFIENMSYQGLECTNLHNVSTSLRQVISKIVKSVINYNPNLVEIKMLQAIYIDSFIRTLETVVDSRDKLDYEEVLKSLSYCRAVEDLVKQYG